MLQILCKTVAIFLGKHKISTLSFFFYDNFILYFKWNKLSENWKEYLITEIERDHMIQGFIIGKNYSNYVSAKNE